MFKYFFVIFMLCFSIQAQLKTELRPISVASVGENVYVAGESGHLVLVQKSKFVKSSHLKSKLIKVRAKADAVYVLQQGAKGALITLDPISLDKKAQIDLEYYPSDFRIHEKTVYITYPYIDLVEARDLNTGKVLWKQTVAREPIALNLSDGKVWVVTHLTHHQANTKHVSNRLVVLNKANGEMTKSLNFPDGANAAQSLEKSFDKPYFYTAFVIARHRVPTTQIARGWINTNAFAVIDIKNESIKTVLLDDLDQGAPNPWGLATRKAEIAVALSGSNELFVINEEKLLDKMANTSFSQKVLSYKLSFLFDVSKKTKTNVRGLRSVAAGEKRWHFAGFFDHEYQSLSYAGKLTRPLELGRASKSLARKGEELFFNAAESFQQWQSCASCHPHARSDAMNWDREDDGIGSFRNTKSVLFSHFTAPTTITGRRAHAKLSVRAALKDLLFAEVSESKARAIDAYLMSLKPQESPQLVDGKLSEKAERGKLLFEGKAGCADCHKGKHLTNMKKRNVGTGLGRDKGRKFDVPSLKEIWRTRPYLHDGRALTVKEIFTKYNESKSHGDAADLSSEELDDLVEYVLSL